MRLRRLFKIGFIISFIGVVGFVVLCAAYVFGGVLESDWQGQVLHLRHIHDMGPRFQRQSAWGVFPRAKGLLRPSFTDNTWVITSADGHTLYSRARTWWHVRLSDIPSHVRRAFVFAEDQRFDQHGGVDGIALLRAMMKTVFGDSRQGGSTLAMQAARLSMLPYHTQMPRTGPRLVMRKMKEMLMAWRLVKEERRDAILEFYLNQAFMAPGIKGIGPAAKHYFRKTPRQLSVGEAAFIAAMLPSPSHDPRNKRYQRAHEQRRQTLLQRMHDEGALSAGAYRKSKRRPPTRQPLRRRPTLKAPESTAAAFRAIDPILKRFDLGRTPWELRAEQPFPLRVRVSLNMRLSWDFYEAIRQHRPRGAQYAVIIALDGRPVVLLGGQPDKWHNAFQGPRQVGSVSKLFFYEAVWQLGLVHPDATVRDGDLPCGDSDYRPRNNTNRSYKPMPHHRSLSKSVNRIACRSTWGDRTPPQRQRITQLLLHRFVFPWQHVSSASRKHFKHVFSTDPSVALGSWSATPFEVAGMLEKGFRGSSLTRQRLLLSWNDKRLDNVPRPSGRGLQRHLMNALQAAVRATAPAADVRVPGLRLAAKTGTTNEGRDAWLAGFVLTDRQTRQRAVYPRLTFVAWSGYNDNRAAGLSGGSVQGPIFGRFLQDKRAQRTLRKLLAP